MLFMILRLDATVDLWLMPCNLARLKLSFDRNIGHVWLQNNITALRFRHLAIQLDPGPVR